jgi:putative flippase GtrA
VIFLVNSPAAPMSASRLVIFYALFAGLSILANIGFQKVSLLVYAGAFSVPLSVVVETGVGLVVKFALDKISTFRYRHRDLSHGKVLCSTP